MNIEDAKKVEKTNGYNISASIPDLVGMLHVWVMAGKEGGEWMTEAKRIFLVSPDEAKRNGWKKYRKEKDLGLPLNFTVTQTKRQLRVWYGLPGLMESEHVDSGSAKGYLLMAVYGVPDAIDLYLKQFLKVYPLPKYKLGNGVEWYISDNQYSKVSFRQGQGYYCNELYPAINEES